MAVEESVSIEKIESLVRRLEGVAMETPWSDSVSGQACALLAFDLVEHCWGMLELAKLRRWTPAMTLMRPAQERMEYLFAVAHDEDFAGRYLASSLMEGSAGSRASKIRVGEARGVLRRVVAEDDEELAGRLLRAHIEAHDLASAQLHPTAVPVRVAVRARFGEDDDQDLRDKIFRLIGGRVSLVALIVAETARSHGGESPEIRHALAESFAWATEQMGLDRSELLAGATVQVVERAPRRWWESGQG